MLENIKAKKQLGQNFLTDEAILEKIAGSIEKTDKNILEIWPGYGALTWWILRDKIKNLDLVEFDADMIPRLEAAFWNKKNLHIHHQDILKYHQKNLPFSIIANIPYYITAPILLQFLYPENSDQIPEEMVILMQKEVAEKIQPKQARKKTKHSLFWLILHEACQSIEYLFDVPKTAFDPIPKVDSAVLRFVTKKNRERAYEDKKIEIWKKAFALPRKTLLSNLKNHYEKEMVADILLSLGHKKNIRAEELSGREWDTFVSFF